jgi:hypothetical protein
MAKLSREGRTLLVLYAKILFYSILIRPSRKGRRLLIVCSISSRITTNTDNIKYCHHSDTAKNAEADIISNAKKTSANMIADATQKQADMIAKGRQYAAGEENDVQLLVIVLNIRFECLK